MTGDAPSVFEPPGLAPGIYAPAQLRHMVLAAVTGVCICQVYFDRRRLAWVWTAARQRSLTSRAFVSERRPGALRLRVTG